MRIFFHEKQDKSIHEHLGDGVIQWFMYDVKKKIGIFDRPPFIAEPWRRLIPPLKNTLLFAKSHPLPSPNFFFREKPEASQTVVWDLTLCLMQCLSKITHGKTIDSKLKITKKINNYKAWLSSQDTIISAREPRYFRHEKNYFKHISTCYIICTNLYTFNWN